MDQFLSKYATKYKKWLNEKKISHSSRVIPINESLSATKQTLITDQAAEVLLNARLITVAECACRKRYQRCDKPVKVCFILNETGEARVNKGLAEEIGLEESIRLLKEANKNGLVHMTLYMPDHEIFALCSCCSCCCHDLQLVLEHGMNHLLIKADYIAVDDRELCIGCGECADRCQFNARSFESNSLSYSSQKCTGCGLCVTTCPSDAISMQERKC